MKYKKVVRIALTALTAAIALPHFVYAQDVNPIENVTNKSQTNQPISSGLQFNLPTSTGAADVLGQGLQLPSNSFNSPISLPSELIGTSVFNLDVLDTACITGQGSCVTGGSRSDLGLTTLISTNPEKKLGLSLRPRAALRVTDDGSSARLGGVVEFSRKSKAGSDFDNNTWYFFAGADAETVNYSNIGVNDLTRDGFLLQDRIFVGDAKAGLGYRIGGADLSLSYLRRQATSDELTYKEDAAALSFTWKR
ncbi:MAG: hypothetical protein ABJG88_13675 [Litorimonas sp.]